MNLLQKFKNWYNAPNREPINLRNIWRILQSWWRRNDTDTPMHLVEQVERRKELANKNCVSTDVCLCGCQFSEMIWSDEGCVGGCFGKMLKKGEWEKYKKENNIIIYNNEN